MLYCCTQYHHQLDVEVNGLCCHHNESDQEEVLQQSSHDSAQTGNWRTVNGHDEGQVESQQGKAKVEQQLTRV